MKISVVISAYSLNRYDILTAAVKALISQTYKEIEVIIVIDVNRELYDSLDRFIVDNNYGHLITLAFNPVNKGLSYSRNLGISKSTGEIVAFIDDDAIPDPNWCEKICETFSESTDRACVVGNVFPLWESNSMAWFPEELYWMLSCSYPLTPRVKTEVDRGFGVNMAFIKEVLVELGMFDTRLGINGKKWIGGEDTDIFNRILKINKKIIFNPGIIVHHKIPEDRIRLKNIAKRAFNGGYSIVIFRKIVPYELKISLEKDYMRKVIGNFYLVSAKRLLKMFSPVKLKQLVFVTIVILFQIFGIMYGILESGMMKKPVRSRDQEGEPT